MPLTDLMAIEECRLVTRWYDVLPRHPDQLTELHEGDAELVRLPDGSILALTTDSIAEELALGLYDDPETAGWVAAVASLSDLAAVGAMPIGLLAAVTLPHQTTGMWQDGIGRGLAEACADVGTWVLGGDTSLGDAIALTTTAAGIIAPGRYLTRRGAALGDVVCCTGPLGAGVGPVARCIPGLPALPSHRFRPRARVAAGQAMAAIASCGIDTSDGLIAALDQLARLNSVGIEITSTPDALLIPSALAFCRTAGLDPLVPLAQPHGEFELVYTVPAHRYAEAAEAMRAAGCEPVELGRVAATPGLRFTAGRYRDVDGAAVRNLAAHAAADPAAFLVALSALVAGQ